MKTKILCTVTISFLLCLSACQNRTSKNEDQTMEMSDSSMNADLHAESSEMMGAKDKMMNEMHKMAMTGNVDVDFALMMKSHHQAALDMARVELSSGSDEQLKSMAREIIEAQKKEIDQLEHFLDTNEDESKNYDPANKKEGFGKVLDKNMMMMMDMPKSGKESIDMQFATLMIPHHQSAVYMAEGLLNSGKDATLISMSKKMISGQNKEIEEFRMWKDKHK
ncbi:DUF305 domain-containing protein [Pedobacter sp. P351]|uniref:DUF305 domain-containing protein n=1 Tax=Pedobacter superstes TaxID=3133441 RepID=UPI0030B3D317